MYEVKFAILARKPDLCVGSIVFTTLRDPKPYLTHVTFSESDGVYLGRKDPEA